MVRLPDNWDPEAPGSRYTTRVALALQRGEEYMHRAEAGDRDVAAEVIQETLGDEPGHEAGLGECRVVDGSYGRGAAGWIPVVEWLGLAIASGIAGGAAWAAATRAGAWLKRQVDDLRNRGERVFVSRGAAVLLAVNHVLEKTQEEGPLDLEAAEDPVSMTGETPSELGYVGIEPWLVSLINADFTRRYVVAISAAGEPLSMMAMPMTEVEKIYSRIPPASEQ